jgi:hypothetical protein
MMLTHRLLLSLLKPISPSQLVKSLYLTLVITLYQRSHTCIAVATHLVPYEMGLCALTFSLTREVIVP